MVQIIRITFIVLLISTNLYSKILLEKNEIIITNYDLEIFLNNKYTNISQNTNQTQALKKIYLIKKTLNKIREKNPIYMSSLDKELKLDNKQTKNFSDEILRYSKITENLVKDYLINNLKLEDITLAISQSDEILVSLSSNKCFTISELINIKEIENFDQQYYEKIKDPNYYLTYEFNSNNYEICLDNNVNKKIEINLLSNIEKKIEKDLYKYIYEK